MSEVKLGVGSYHGVIHRLNYNKEGVLDIGKYTSIAQELTVLHGGGHYLDRVSTHPFTAKATGVPFEENPNIVIGSDVWIGYGVTILSGVTIGDGAIVGAGTLINKDVKPYTVVVGRPMKVVRKRFTDKQIQGLLKIKWWDWTKEKIEESIPALESANVKEFLRKNLTAV